jgi:Rho GDP-dissociation inhibitor
MASHDEDILNHEESNYQVKQPKQSLAEYQQMDAGDESLQRYKESLGLGGGKDLSDPNDPRTCIILSLTMKPEGREPITVNLATDQDLETMKDKEKTPFKIKEGTKFVMASEFKVQHEILSGLRYVQIIKRKGIKVGKVEEMIGSYAPNTEKNPTYRKEFPEYDAPSGMIARGSYSCVSAFVDDDKKKHLEFEWTFNIVKDV